MAKQWSTKDLETLTPATKEKSGRGRFHFTDDYSVFHFSKMPDPIAGKGEAICRMAAFSLGLLEQAGIPTHLQSVVGAKTHEIKLLRILYPQNGDIGPGEKNYVLPLQIVCRNILPEGASVFRRLREGKVTLAELNLSEMPVAGQKLKAPLIEFTTKREEIDRFITPDEARALACLSLDQFDALKKMTMSVNQVITAHAESVGLLHADSKIELGIDDQGRLMVVDTVGTTDENRFLFDGFHVTKQVLRNYYLVRGLEKNVQTWVALNQPRSTWATPERLPEEYPRVASQLYKAMCERWIGQAVFEAPKLESVVRALQNLETKWVQDYRRDAVSA